MRSCYCDLAGQCLTVEYVNSRFHFVLEVRCYLVVDSDIVFLLVSVLGAKQGVVCP